MALDNINMENSYHSVMYKINRMMNKAALDRVRIWFMDNLQSVEDDEVLAKHYKWMINNLNFQIKRDYSDVPYPTVDNIREILEIAPSEFAKKNEVLSHLSQEDILNSLEITSREQYLDDKKAIKLWNFLKRYVGIELSKYGQENIYIPAYIVLDALSRINQDKIEYSTV